MLAPLTGAHGRVSVGLRLPRHLFEGNPDGLRAAVARAEAAGIDRLTTGDHVSFNGGQGFDGLALSAAMAALTTTATVQTSVYLLGLRHPVPVARQVATVAQLAPGRFVFGVGVGGEDRHEWAVCGVDPSSRGSRVDESLAVVRALLTGKPLTHHGRFFHLDEAQIRPAPSVPVPVIVGGRSAAAFRRTATMGDGWLGLFTSPERYSAAVAEVERLAGEAGRGCVDWRHGMYLWCSFDRSPAMLASAMEDLYRIPFERFARYCPSGPADTVAAHARAYVDAGATHINLAPVAAAVEDAIDGATEVKRLLNG